MTQLIDVHHFHLTPYILRMLHTHEIKTVAHLALATNRMLSTVANLSADVATEIRQYLLAEYGPLITDGLALKDIATSRTFLLQTGIQGLDSLLQPGIMSGSLVELSGHVLVGKSILLLTIALHSARHHDMRTLIVSTTRSYGGFRIYRLLKEMGCDQTECGAVMNRLHYEQVTDGRQFVGVLQELLDNGRDYDYELLVVDSLASLLLPYSGEHSKQGRSVLTEVMILMRHIAEHRNKIVFIESLVLGGNHQSSSNITKTSNVASTITHSCPTIPSLRLHLSNDDLYLDSAVQSQSQKKRIHVLKSTQHPTGGSCTVRLTPKGVVSV